MKSKTDPLAAEPHPIVLRSLWYIAPVEMRTKAVEAASRAEDFETFDDDSTATPDPLALSLIHI